MRYLRYLALIMICVCIFCACGNEHIEISSHITEQTAEEPEGTAIDEEPETDGAEAEPLSDTPETDSESSDAPYTTKESEAETTTQPEHDDAMYVETETGKVRVGVNDGNLTFVDAHGNIRKVQVHSDWPMNDYDPLAFKMRDYSIDHDYWKTKDMRMTYESDDYDYRLGIDVFGEHGGIDWWAVESAGYDFAIMRAGYRGYKYPALVQDERVIENLKGALKYGMDVGVYFFSQAIDEEEAEEEAEFVMDMLEDADLGPEDLKMGIIFDPESILDDESRTDNVSGKQFTKNAIAFCERAKEKGYKVMIYSNMVWEAKKFDLKELSEYPVWYADYTDHPQTPYAFEIWQYGHAIVPGVASQVDVNIELIRK